MFVLVQVRSLLLANRMLSAVSIFGLVSLLARQ